MTKSDLIPHSLEEIMRDEAMEYRYFPRTHINFL